MGKVWAMMSQEVLICGNDKRNLFHFSKGASIINAISLTNSLT